MAKKLVNNSDDEMIKISHRIRELRRAKYWTQRHVADLLNKSPTGYASWEQGLSEPGIEDLRKLCIIYNVSADYLLGLED